MKSKSRNIFFFCLSFLLIYFLLDKLVMFGVSRSRSGQLGKVNKVCSHDQLPQLAIFGSSVGEFGINAPMLQRQTKLSTYNFCINGTRFSQYKGLIDELANDNGKTQYVILADSYFSLTRVDALNVFERWLANISNENIYRSLYKIQPGVVWKSRYVPLYKYTSVTYQFYLSALDGWKNYFSKKQKPDTLLGYLPVNKKWQQAPADTEKAKESFLISPDSSIVEDYKRTVINLTSKGMKVIMVIPPVYAVVSNKIVDLSILKQALAKIAAETHCPFWDFTNNSITKDQSCFYNVSHLNSKGADIFSGMLADSIKHFMRSQNPKPGL